MTFIMNGKTATNEPTTRREMLESGRQAYCRQEWSRAYSDLLAADEKEPLDPADLECLAKSAYILGNDAEGAEILARAHKRFLEQEETLPAVRCAFWLGFTLLLRGESAQAGGWLSRAARLLEGHEDCVEKGYLLLPDGYRHVHGGDAATGYELFKKVTEAGTRFNDRDLTTFGLNGQGRALILLGEIERGVACLDEAMVAVTSGEVSPLTAGGVYCSVIEACSDIFDLRRAQEWTTALDRWCSTQSDQLLYRGHCMLRRAEILQLHGTWTEALDEAMLATERLSDSPQQRAAGAAFYRMAELHRVRGEFEKAEAAYKQANQLGANVQPGLAQLRLMEGQIDVASAAIRGPVREAKEIRYRANVLAACVEIMLAAKDIEAARSVSAELVRMAEDIKAPLLNAIADRAHGAVLLAAGDVDDALTVLRQAFNVFREVDAPYDEALVRVLLAEACQKQQDCDTAELEMDVACGTFERLGAVWDLARAEGLIRDLKPASEDPLTKREAEVLKLVATGKTNRDIANELFISEKTVARHLSNIFVKLDLTSRAAATAYAYQNDLF
jgi:ATP/maltotriose-dependent transcriptional regulator MalT